MILAILLGLVGLLLFVRLLFACAAHALPLWAGASTAIIAFQNGAGWLGAPVAGLIVASTLLALGRRLLASRNMPSRLAVALAFAAPAALAGYHTVRGPCSIGGMEEPWRTLTAALGAPIVAAAALASLGRAAPGSASQAKSGTAQTPRSLAKPEQA